MNVRSAALVKFGDFNERISVQLPLPVPAGIVSADDRRQVSRKTRNRDDSQLRRASDGQLRNGDGCVADRSRSALSGGIPAER